MSRHIFKFLLELKFADSQIKNMSQEFNFAAEMKIKNKILGTESNN